MSIPTTFAAALQDVAKFCDMADQVTEAYAREIGFTRPDGSPYVPGNEVQDDLRSIALWIEANPTASLDELDAYYRSIATMGRP